MTVRITAERKKAVRLFSCLLTLGCVASVASFAQQGTGKPADADPMQAALRALDAKQAATNPTYSVAVLLGKDPHERLAECEARLCSGGSLRRCPAALAWAAKAAVEAGENQKARDYAVESLQSADAMVAGYAKLGRIVPRSSLGGSTADYYGNFVLGRLAVLDGDVRSAEKYLLASGKTVGDPVLKSFGPNMSLALELLKHGDAQSRQVVLEFLDEVKLFWPTPSIDKWAAEISAGETPTFRADGDGASKLFN